MENCKYCNSKNLKTQLNGSHKQLYCDDCNRHQSFVKLEKNIETGEIATAMQIRYAQHLMQLAMKNKTLTKRQAGLIISALKDHD